MHRKKNSKFSGIQLYYSDAVKRVEIVLSYLPDEMNVLIKLRELNELETSCSFCAF